MNLEKEDIKIYNDDCLNILKEIPDNSIDLVVTDCPYHIVSGGCSNGAYGDGNGIFTKNSSKDDESTIYARQGKFFKHNDIKFNEWLPEIYRVLKNDTHCYIYINARNLKDLQTEAEKIGFIFQQLIVWNKGNCTPNRYYLNAYELILMLRKGNAKKINNMRSKNIIEIPNVRGKVHPTEKPVELNKILIENSSNVGDIVLDPFMGSGSCGVACKETGRKFIGIEIDEKYYKISEKRLNKINTTGVLSIESTLKNKK